MNELFVLIADRPLFKTVVGPREWGWVLRPSTQEWHQFLLASDKLLSENLDHKTLTAAGVDRNGEDGDLAGSLTRLQWFLERVARVGGEGTGLVLGPLRRVRQERQKPAHALVVAGTDASLVALQRDLLADIGDSLEMFRGLLTSHPAARGWSVPSILTETLYRL